MNDPVDEGASTQSVKTHNDSAVTLPQQIGRYRIEKVLGKGSFGLVYLAHDDQLKRLVAIKVPHAHLVAHADLAEDYLTEARTVANLDHPHIVPVHDVGSTDEFPCFIVSKYIDGTDLAERLKQSRLSLRETVELMATVAEALHHAHKQGLVHRDIKPGNLLLDRNGLPFVADFGLAQREQDIGTGPRFAGTPAYMSPEQARSEGHRVDGRSDIFSLGAVFYEMLTGIRPFRGNELEELLEQITVVEARPLRQIDDQIPKELERICLKALSKRMTERYPTAKDMADDLRYVLTQQSMPVMPGIGAASNEPSVPPTSTLNAAEAPVTSAAPGSKSWPIKIVPKGLRSFDAHDADFYLELLPGPRDRDGLPESLRFWKTQIEKTGADNTFSVGLIYGPSGCGKSSLVKAGLLPRLSANVISVYVEATAEDTETRLLNGLRKRCPSLPDNLNLHGTLATLRRGQGIPAGKKVVIILDQFEQWLHGNKEQPQTDLVRALRQCDSERVQCIVMVRVDFMLAASRFLDNLEVELAQGKNFALADLFDLDHAHKVLSAFGQAFGRLPEKIQDASKDQNEFLRQAISGLAEDGKVISVRLALFAEMMKGKPWIPTSLNEVGGTQGVGVAFLEETFSAQSYPQYRLHHQAARAVLNALLPESGTDIKGHMRSETELLEAAGYASRPREFDNLVRILDGEIRLITPTDPAGADDAIVKATAGQKYYQLTHDYLVHSLRDWLTRKQKETRRGRAELRLSENAALWHAKPDARHLPSWWEYLSATLLIPKKNRSAEQQAMLFKAGRVHAIRWGSALAVLLAIGFAIGNVVSNERQNSLRSQVVTAVDAVQSNRGLAVPLSLKELKKLPREFAAAELKKRYPNSQSQHKLGLAFALAAYDEIDIEYLCSQIPQAAPDEVDNLVTAFGQSRDASLAAIHMYAKNAEAEQRWRLKARMAIIALQLEEDHLASDMCQIRDRPDPIQRTLFTDEFSNWHGNVAKLAIYSATRSDAALQSGLCLGMGGISPELLADDERDNSVLILKRWYETSPETVTHSSAGWALRKWRVESPTLSMTHKPSEGRKWFVNSLGLTLLQIEPGVFFQKVDDSSEPEDQRIKRTQAFFLCDREISVGQFQQFVDDATCSTEEKPEKWDGALAHVSPTPDHPVQAVSWFDSVLFCNWLSRKEDRTPCFERTEKNERMNNEEYVEWRLVPLGTGYRLPTEAEWEYACRAGTTTDFSSGNDAELLRKYAVFQESRAELNGSKLPNGWGLFDMHGNVYEWCNDTYGGSDRVHKGGGWFRGAAHCRSAYRYTDAPGYRYDYIGFRVALSNSIKATNDAARVPRTHGTRGITGSSRHTGFSH